MTLSGALIGFDLDAPIAVFDAGIGSYAIVDLIRRRQPRRDIVYFADRARFPYGAKSRDTLLLVMQATIAFLSKFSPQAIVMASNAPSIMVLDSLRAGCAVPLHGVEPPVEQAMARSMSRRIGILGVRSLIDSAELVSFVRARVPDPAAVALINASAMVELVESGVFLSDPKRTRAAVSRFTDEIAVRHPETDTFTLSSTHLPWLRSFFEMARPDWRFLDPAESVVAALPLPAGGTGRTLAMITESSDYNVASFAGMLARLGVNVELTVIDPHIG